MNNAPFVKVTAKLNGAPFDCIAYTVWCNETTGDLSVRTETGIYKFKAADVVRIEYKN